MLTIPRLRRAALVSFATALAVLLSTAFVLVNDGLTDLSGWSAAVALIMLALPFTLAGVGLGYLFVSWDARKRVGRDEPGVPDRR